MTQRNRNRKKTRALFRRVLAKALSVQEELKVSEWAERVRLVRACGSKLYICPECGCEIWSGS